MAVDSPAPRPLPRIIAIANQKGGVGKTTTSVNLGACLAELGYRVLLVDLDPQGNLSSGLGIDTRTTERSTYDVLLHDVDIEDTIEVMSLRNLFVAPANTNLKRAETELKNVMASEQRLKRALDSVRDEYDFVLIDCPPSRELLTKNALVAASEVLVPIQCEYYALEGVGQLIDLVEEVRKYSNDTLELSTIICVMFDARTQLSSDVVREAREHFGEKVMPTVIPRSVRLAEAPSHHQPINVYDPASKGAIAYRLVAKEVAGGATPRSR